jgi:hypothetical protein
MQTDDEVAMIFKHETELAADTKLLIAKEQTARTQRPSATCAELQEWARACEPPPPDGWMSRLALPECTWHLGLTPREVQRLPRVFLMLAQDHAEDDSHTNALARLVQFSVLPKLPSFPNFHHSQTSVLRTLPSSQTSVLPKLPYFAHFRPF